MKQLFIVLLFTILAACSGGSNNNPSTHSYLLKPTGLYGVGFQNLYWINEQACPDPFWTGDNNADFRSDNPNHCREMMLSIYYPTDNKTQQGAIYNNPLNKSYYAPLLSGNPGITKEHYEELDQLRSFAVENAKISSTPNFPVLIFSPGFGLPTSVYENLITESVSHGYIVVGINSAFINRSQLPNGRVVNAIVSNLPLQTHLPLQTQDISFVLDALKSQHGSSELFQKMDLNHIGGFGHSIGARAIADAIHANQFAFRAGVTLDIATHSAETVKQASVPFMHIIAAGWRNPARSLRPVDLNNKNYLIELKPNKNDHDYSQHLFATDLSTLQYLSGFQGLTNYRQEQARIFSLRFMSHEPTSDELKSFDKSTWVLIQTQLQGQWSLVYYSSGIKVTEVPVAEVNGLDSALSQLPNSEPEKFTPNDTAKIVEIMFPFNMLIFALLGTANGTELTQNMNTYLVDFFDTYLKNTVNPNFQTCTPLSSDTLMHCGPGIF
jgi:hypothetical protein